jgi:excisionase family DNA binding protein
MRRRVPLDAPGLRRMVRSGELLKRVPPQGPRDPGPPEVLTQAEVAELLRVERHHVKKLIEMGLPYVRVGSLRRFFRRAVLAWMTANGDAG